MEGSNPTTPPESLAQALGGINVPVTFRDGTSGTAFVRELRLKQYDGMMAALGDDEALLRAYTDQPAGWADTLTVEALDAVLKTGDELNALGFYPLAREALGAEPASAAETQAKGRRRNAKDRGGHRHATLAARRSSLGSLVFDLAAAGALRLADAPELTFSQLQGLDRALARRNAAQRLDFLQSLALSIGAAMHKDGAGPLEKEQQRLLAQARGEIPSPDTETTQGANAAAKAFARFAAGR